MRIQAIIQCRPHRCRHALWFAKRRGVVLPLVAIFIVVLIAMAAFAVDVAYMQLVRTQLRVASDSAAKAGTAALVPGMSCTEAQNAAMNIASLNHVAGKPLILTSSDISLGQSVLQSDGTWKFVAGMLPYQAMQVSPSLSKNNANGSVPLFFGPFLGTSFYSPSNTAVASAFACEVCLVVDRSHSMCWDLSGNTDSHPSPIYTNVTLGIESPPLPGSRWLALDAAVNTYCNILMTANAPPRVAVVTWASDIDTSTPEYAMTGQTSPAVTTDLPLSTNYSAVYAAIHNRENNVMLGGTDMSSGINQGTAILTASNVRPFAKKVMILMTDGQWNAGIDPVVAAAAAASQNITIHCVCFLQGADQTTCQQIASMTGGKFYYAVDQATLHDAFADLAFTLPVVLTH